PRRGPGEAGQREADGRDHPGRARARSCRPGDDVHDRPVATTVTVRPRRPSTKIADRRLRVLLVVFAVGFAVTLVRAAWLQTVQASSLARKGASQQHETFTVPAGRGTIFDRSGVQLAIGEQATTVYANPREIVNARAVARAAGETLGVDANALYPQLLDRSKGFVYVAREADPVKAAAL